jgi:hypothetical protein
MIDFMILIIVLKKNNEFVRLKSELIWFVEFAKKHCD